MGVDGFFEQMFARMTQELLQNEKPCFETMCVLARQTVFASIRIWCVRDSRLRHRDCAEDIMQEVCVRLMITCIPGFLLRGGELNYDPNGFKNWLFTVAKNIKSDYAKKYGDEPLYILDDEDVPENEEASRSLAGAMSVADSVDAFVNASELLPLFRTVIRSDSSVHKVLTWLTQALLMLDEGLAKKDTNAQMEKYFSGMALGEMYDYVRGCSRRISWLQLKDEEWLILERQLDASDGSGTKLRDKRYGDFYMAKGARPSISDWVNRINGKLKSGGE